MKAYQVTLTSANTPYQLLALVRAIDAGFVDFGDIVIQPDDDGGAQVFLLGDSSLSSTRYGQKMHAGDFSPHISDLAGAYMQCDTAGKAVNILIANRQWP